MACNGRLKASDALLSHTDARLFATSQWPIHPSIFLAYRLFLALYLLSWLVVMMSTASSFGGFFVFLTNWTFTVLTAYAVSSCVGTLYFALSKETNHNSFDAMDSESQQLLHTDHRVHVDDPPSTDDSTAEYIGPMPPKQEPTQSSRTLFPRYFKFSWLLFNICLSVNPIVTVIFWVFLYQPGLSPLSQSVNVNAHALNTVFIYFDLFLSARPVRFLHFIYAILYGVVYATFTLIYYLAGGLNPETGDPAIYPNILDWSNPGWTVLSVVMVIIAAPLTHLAGYGCYKIRVLSHIRCFSKSRNEVNS